MRIVTGLPFVLFTILFYRPRTIYISFEPTKQKITEAVLDHRISCIALKDLCMCHIYFACDLDAMYACHSSACPHRVEEYASHSKMKINCLSRPIFAIPFIRRLRGAVKCAFVAFWPITNIKNNNNQQHLCESYTTIKRFDSLHVVHYYYY